MFVKGKNKAVRLATVLAAIVIAFAVSCVAMLSGGLSAVTAVLWMTGIILIWLVYGARGVGGAILSALVCVAGVGLLQVTAQLPPAILGFSWRVEMWMFLGLALLGLASMFRVRAVLEGEREDHRAASPPAFDIWADAPFAVISLSEHGRVRSVAGHPDLLRDIKIGQVFDSDMFDGHSSVAIETIGQRVFLSHAPEGQDANYAKLETKLRERTRFFAGLGHDLKSPLNAVIGFSDMMDTEISGPMPDAYREYPGLIKESGETLLRFVEDMLDYARSEAGTYELDPAVMDVAASGDAVLRQSQAASKTAHVALVMDTREEVLALADASAVRRIWDNLVSNAIKYSTEGDIVKLRAHRGAEGAVIEVEDNGAGMDATDLAAIAQPFEQGRNARGRAGTGLGLAMVKRLAEMHGGQVRIETAKGEGTRVSVTLPAPPQVMRKAAE